MSKSNTINFSETKFINKALVICYSVAVGLGLAGFLSSLISDPQEPTRVVLWLTSCVLPYIICDIVYFRNKQSKTVQYFMSFGYMVFYLYSIISEFEYIYIFVYIFPVLIILIACNNIKLIYAIGGVTVAVNIYDTISSWNVVPHAENLSRLSMVGICAAFAVFAAKVSGKLTQQKLDLLEEEKEAADEITKSMSDSINGLNINKNNLSESISSTSSVVATINSGMNDAVNSIQKQMDATENIKRLVGEAKSQVSSMDSAIKDADESVNDGSTNITELSQSTDTLKLKNDIILKVLNGLEKDADEVKNIVGIINGIASQTKILSLNASIEAARAGEHGKGFAVVADEVNCLSKKTGDFINQISEIIDTLNNEIISMKSAVDDMMSANELQNSVIEKVSIGFSSIKNSMDQVKDDMSALTLHIDNVSDHTEEIVTDAANVSAISEHILDSTNEADLICEKNAAIVNTISEIANTLQVSADTLNGR